MNMSDGPVWVMWQFPRPTKARVLFENRAMPRPANSESDAFEPWEVHIYQW